MKLTSETSKNEHILEIVRDENLNLNKNLLEEGEGGGGIYRRSVRIKGGQAKCVRFRARGEGSLILAIFVRTYHVEYP